MTTRTLCILVLLAVLGSPTFVRAQPARDDPPAVRPTVHSIHWLVEQKKQWSGWGAIRRRLIVEGRYSFLLGRKLRMRNCPLDFVPEKDAQLNRPVSESRNLEITGHMGLDGNDPVFVVEEMVTLPSDETVYRTRRAAVARGTSDGWYELADWCEARGTFYDDDDLLAKARDARAEGIAVEHEAIDASNPDALFALAAKVTALEFSPRLAAQLRHEGWRARWNAVADPEAKPTTEDYTRFAGRLAKAYPEAAKPATKPIADTLRTAYKGRPNDTYARAEDPDRLRLHRVFYAEVVLRELLGGYDERSGNEATVAAAISKRVPEHEVEATRLRERALQRELAKVTSMTQAEMAKLADRLRRDGDGDRADEVVREWLAAKEARLREEGAEGLIEAADFYESLTADSEKVARLLMEAYEKRPDSEPISARLTKLGYHLHDGRWTTEAGPGAAAPRRAGPLGVAVGMTREDVIAALGTPRAVSRVASAGQLTEVWVYGPRGAAGFTVHLVRNTLARNDPGRVVKVAQRSPR